MNLFTDRRVPTAIRVLSWVSVFIFVLIPKRVLSSDKLYWLWLMSGLIWFGLLQLTAAMLKARAERIAMRRRAAGRCPACGYDLRATPRRCPECGAVRDG